LGGALNMMHAYSHRTSHHVGSTATTSVDGDGPEANARTPLLLVVEDDQQAREGLAEFLLTQGYRVSDADDGAEALAKVEAFRPDVVLLDLALPKMDGWSVTRRLKSDRRFKQVAVIAMSWLDYPAEIGRVFEAGCDAFLSKPLNLSRLVPVIERVMGQR